ncbi:hypothetical protein PaeBR_13300 [Paenibacillus sp. BR2-3]|uniref:hypothetical protein n=1 Tax=Paenibacillus sp. BR2-3 TaxID=3048494 RepID=UPI003977C8A4
MYLFNLAWKSLKHRKAALQLFPGVPLQMIVLGLIFIVLTAFIFGLFAYFAGVFSGRLLEKPRVQEGANIGAAVIFMCLGLKLLTTSP